MKIRYNFPTIRSRIKTAWFVLTTGKLIVESLPNGATSEPIDDTESAKELDKIIANLKREAMFRSYAKHLHKFKK